MAETTAIHEYSLSRDGAKRVGRHFRVREFACHDGTDKILISTATVELLDKIREFYDLPVVVLSGYRTPAWNRKVGGAKLSQHVVGTATDFVVRQPNGGIISPQQVYSDIDSGKIFGKHAGGLGRYRTFTHIDTRGHRSRWSG